MTSRLVSWPAVVFTVGLVLLGSASARQAGDGAGMAEEVPDVDARAKRILREMGEYLSAATELAFDADLSYDSVMADGQKIQYGAVTQASVRRPDRLRVEYNGDERQSRVVFDGRTFTVYDAAANVYAVTEVPSNIDAALDQVFESYGFSVPIADLFYADPYGILIENVEAGFFVGRHPVDGTHCNHLAFAQEEIDWQIWIEDGPRPVPRKLVITYKSEEGSPQYVARLSNWDFEPRFSKYYFEFDAPVGSGEIEFLTLDVIPEKEVQP